MKIGDTIKIKEPFSIIYPDYYEIEDIKDNTIFIRINDDLIAFDFKYIEAGE